MVLAPVRGDKEEEAQCWCRGTIVHGGHGDNKDAATGLSRSSGLRCEAVTHVEELDRFSLFPAQ